ncbi:MAG: Rhomboid family protein [Pedosphaera sp.]|nr:Rhomboid family protein [Pedosphaera sp.]
MRIIGHLEGEAKARAFSDYLYVQGIENQVEEADQGNSWAVWIHAEEELEKAKGLLAAFQQNPTDPKIKSAASAADDLREKKKKEQLEYEKRMKKRRHLFRPMTAYGVGLATFALIGICIVVFVMSDFSNDLEKVRALFISDYDIREAARMGGWDGMLMRIAHIKDALPEVQKGEIWRLLTPMFIHMSLIHIFFNMLWLRDLGSMVEARQNGGTLLILVLAFALISNLAQYFMSGPIFGGMSGVVYGLVGYIWIRGKWDPGSGLYLHPSTVTMMIVWFFICLAGVVGDIANTAHATGLLAGMAWGYLSSLRHR